ncbi:hypothetical protein [Streptomyces sp. NPDC003710]
MENYVVVSTTAKDKTIVAGPYLWDGVTSWTPPEAGKLMTEAQVLAKGYVYPPQGE